MIPPQRSRSGGGIAFKYGLIAGALLSAITIVVFVILLIPGTSDVLYKMMPEGVLGDYLSLYSVVISLFVALLNMVVYFFTGLFAARRTGKIGTAMLACLWALLCFLVIDACVYVIDILRFLTLVQGIQLQHVIISLLTNDILSFLIDLILALLLGFGAGGLGALIGQQRNSYRPLS
jgi:hypothetical protein